MGNVSRFDFKLGAMRKPDSFVVYPRGENDEPGIYTVQGARTIVKVNVNTRQAIVNWRGSNSKYFLHLSKLMGAEMMEVPQDFCNLVREFATAKSDTIAGGVVRLG